MKVSDINFKVFLDKDNVPEKIQWNATDAEHSEPTNTKSICLSLWDDEQKNTLRIDLWTKEMGIDEMKKFYIDALAGMSQSILNATGDTFIANEINDLCEKLALHVENQMRKEQS